MHLDVDVCIVGGGPAGSAAAIRLSMLGYRVCVIERQGLKRLPAAEAVPAGIVPMLGGLGLLSSLDRIGALRCGRTRLDWRMPSGERPTSAFLVDRGAFDSAILEAARRAGAILLASACCRRTTYGEGRWTILADGRGGSVSVTSSFLVEATGRRRDQAKLGPTTAALCGRWRGAKLSGAPEMRIAAGPQSWLWSAPLADGSYTVTCFLDTSRCAALDPAGRRKLYCKLIADTPIGGVLDRAELLGGIKVREATCRHAADPVASRSIRIGDCAFAMDPLSSQGVQAAMQGGVQASIVANTILSGGDADAAMTFYRDAQRTAAIRHLRLIGEIYASQSKFSTPFWKERSTTSVQQKADETRHALLSLNTRIRLSPAAELKELPAVDGMIVRYKPSLSCPQLERPVTWFAGVEVVPLLARVRPGCTALSLVSDWSRAIPTAAAQSLLQWLASEGILIEDAG